MRIIPGAVLREVGSSEEISSGTDFFAGAHYLGSIGDYLSVKADVAYINRGTDQETSFFQPSPTFNPFSLAHIMHCLILIR